MVTTTTLLGRVQTQGSPHLFPAATRRPAHGQHHAVGSGVVETVRLGQEVQRGPAEPTVQLLGEALQPGCPCEERFVQPRPREVLDEDGGKARPLGHGDAQGRDIAQHDATIRRLQASRQLSTKASSNGSRPWSADVVASRS